MLNMAIVSQQDGDLSPEHRLVQEAENGVLHFNLERYSKVYLFHCADSRCHVTFDRDATQIIEESLDLHTLVEGWYDLVGLCGPEARTQDACVGSHYGVFSVGSPEKYRKRFKWGYSVALIISVICIWGIWAVLDKLMKRGR